MKKGLLYVMAANIVSLTIGVLTNFLLPRFLSIESYANIKTYALYISYAGFLSLGYNDGMYLKYGGKSIDNIREHLGRNYFNYIIIELLMLASSLTISVVLKNNTLLAFSIGMFSTNIMGYLKSLYQATGEFKSYSVALNYEKVAIFVGNILLLLVLKIDEYFYYIIIQIVVGYSLAIILTLKLDSKIKLFTNIKLSFSEIKENICSGFILMVGNFSSNIFTGVDRWFVKLLMSSTNFAFYSYAVSMENILNVFFSPITVSMYNYFCKERTVKEISDVKKLTLIWGFVIIAAGFPAKWILENYLVQYMGACSVLFLLFAAQVFLVIVKGVFVNLYKAEKKQKKYLVQMVTMTFTACILNLVLYRFKSSIESIACATLITAIVWFAICEFEYKMIRFKLNSLLAMIIMLSVYLYCGYYTSAVTGFFIYVIVGSIVLVTLMNDMFKYILGLVKEICLRKKNN